jgi:uncharacterized protein
LNTWFKKSIKNIRSLKFLSKLLASNLLAVYISLNFIIWQRMVLFIAIIVLLFLFLSSLTLILLFIGPTLLLQPRRRRANFYQKLNHPVVPSDLGLNFEETKILTQDGIDLAGWLIKCKQNPKGTIVYLHGVGDCKITGLRFAKLFHDASFNIFLYDSRRHGESGGTYCTYGFHEKEDLRDTIDYLNSRADLRLGSIGVFGTSMGAAVAIQAAATDRRIKAVVAENSFATLRTIFDDYQKRIIKVPFHYLRNIVIIRSEINASFKAREVSPLNSIADINVPQLIVYGSEDKHINYKNSITLYEKAHSPKELYRIENAEHNNCWEIGGEKYRRKLLEFFGGNLN